MIRRKFLIYLAGLLIITQSLYSQNFETETPDILVEDTTAADFSKKQIKSKQFQKENDLYKPDPLLENVREKNENEIKKKESSLFERFFKKSNDEKSNSKKPKSVFKEPLLKSDEFNTDPLLNEI
ncbi:MAG: hypothetical protein L3I99_03705 [Sulfurimonas sp.]|nr:hypothetical protein [Sulfurimonas sp.]